MLFLIFPTKINQIFNKHNIFPTLFKVGEFPHGKFPEAIPEGQAPRAQRKKQNHLFARKSKKNFAV